MLLDRGAPAWTIGIVKMNPMYGFVTFMRDIVLWQQNPSLEILALCAVWSVVMLAIGIFVFRKTEHKFILYI